MASRGVTVKKEYDSLLSFKEFNNKSDIEF